MCEMTFLTHVHIHTILQFMSPLPLLYFNSCLVAKPSFQLTLQIATSSVLKDFESSVESLADKLSFKFDSETELKLMLSKFFNLDLQVFDDVK